MRRSAYVFAPVLAATAASVLSGCHEVKVRPEAASTHSEAAAQTLRGGFGASFNGDTVLWVLGVAGLIAVARFTSTGE